MSGVSSKVQPLVESAKVVGNWRDYAQKNMTTESPVSNSQGYQSASGKRASFVSRQRRALMSGTAGATRLDAKGMAKDMHSDMMKKLLGE
jgi:hypothetical protein